MSVRSLRHDRPSGRFSKSWGLSASVSFLSSPPLPALLLAPFFARSLTLVPRSLLLNRTETLATQAKPSIPCITGGEDANPPSRVSGARAFRARLSSPDKRDKITPVMQANFLKWPPKMQIITFRVREVIASKNRIAIVSPES